MQKATSCFNEEDQLEARVWMMRIFLVWCGNSTWQNICTDQQKVDFVHKFWKAHFFGYGLIEKPKVQEVKRHKKLSKELKTFNKKAANARQRLMEKKDSPKEKIDFTPVSAKLVKKCMVKKKIQIKASAKKYPVFLRLLILQNVTVTNLKMKTGTCPTHQTVEMTKKKNTY